ncbi:hypothetical protein D3C86_1709410 [compost metagenome]
MVNVDRENMNSYFLGTAGTISLHTRNNRAAWMVMTLGKWINTAAARRSSCPISAYLVFLLDL